MHELTMNFHAGNALRNIADNYPTLSKVVLESIQNSIDSGATFISVFINYFERVIIINDNGCGISPSKMESAMKSICESNKKVGCLGQFGIGLMAPLGKCEEFFITSSPRPGHNGYHRWHFDCEKILESSELSRIPEEPLPDFIFSQTGRGAPNSRPVDWRTQVKIRKFTKDKSINNIIVSDLQSLVLNQFSEPMKKLGTKVKITARRSKDKDHDESIAFVAADFQGEKLPPIIYDENKPSQTTFRLYLSPKTTRGRKGFIRVGVENDAFRIPMTTLAKSIRGLAEEETLSILLSGAFEGTIDSRACSLHTNRKEFRENDALMTFCLHLNSWAQNHGTKLILSLKDEQRDLRLQAVGAYVLVKVEEGLIDMPHLQGLVKTFKIGTIGVGHKGFETTTKLQDFPTKAVRHNSSEHHSSDSENLTSQTTPNHGSGQSHPGHMPLTVSGPNGNKRKVVKGHSTGLQIAYEELPGNDHHWEIDPESGTITFNIRSDIWAKMEPVDRNLILYLQYCVIKALEMLLEPPVSRNALYEFLQRELKTAAMFIIQTCSLQPRKAKVEVGKRL